MGTYNPFSRKFWTAENAKDIAVNNPVNQAIVSVTGPLIDVNKVEQGVRDTAAVVGQTFDKAVEGGKIAFQETQKLFNDTVEILQKDGLTLKAADSFNEKLQVIRDKYAPEAVKELLKSGLTPTQLADRMNQEYEALKTEVIALNETAKVYRDQALDAWKDSGIPGSQTVREMMNMTPEQLGNKILEGGQVVFDETVKFSKETIDILTEKGVNFEAFDAINQKAVALREKYAPEMVNELLRQGMTPSEVRDMVEKESKELMEEAKVVYDKYKPIVEQGLSDAWQATKEFGDEAWKFSKEAYAQGEALVKEYGPIVLDKLDKAGKYVVAEGGKLLDQAGELVMEYTPVVLDGLQQAGEYVVVEGGKLLNTVTNTIVEVTPEIAAMLKDGANYTIDQAGNLLQGGTELVMQATPVIVDGLKQGTEVVLNEAGKLVMTPPQPAVADLTRPAVVVKPTIVPQKPVVDVQFEDIKDKRAFDNALKDIEKQVKVMATTGKVPDELKTDIRIVKEYAQKKLDKDYKNSLEGKPFEMSNDDRKKYESALKTATDTEKAIEAFELGEKEKAAKAKPVAQTQQASQGIDGIIDLLVKLVEALTGNKMEVPGRETAVADQGKPTVEVPKPVAVDKEREAAKAEMRQAVKDLVKLDPTPSKQGLSDKDKEAYAEKVADRYVKQNEGKMSVEDMKAKVGDLKKDTAAILKDGKEVAKGLTDAAKNFEAGDMEAAKGDMMKAMAAAKAMSADIAKAMGKVGVDTKDVNPVELSALAPKSTTKGGPAATTEVTAL